MKEAKMSVEIEQADLNNPVHQRAIVELLDMYSQDAMGSASPLSESTRERLIEGLQRHSGTLVLLAGRNGKYIGLCTCFEGFSTFQARPLMNIHDIAVHPDHRNQGIGRCLLAAVEETARQRDCCKLTLEVRRDNPAARHLYGAFGFVDTDPPMQFWHKLLAD